MTDKVEIPGKTGEGRQLKNAATQTASNQDFRSLKIHCQKVSQELERLRTTEQRWTDNTQGLLLCLHEICSDPLQKINAPRWLQSSATISLDDTQGTEGSAAEGLNEGGNDWVAVKELKLSYHNGYI